MNERPDYKNHPLWNLAMSFTRDAYALAQRLRQSEPETGLCLRTAAVAVPAHVASALASGHGKRLEHMLAARAALAEVSRQAGRIGAPGSEELGRAAKDLDRAILFEFGAAEAVS
ncbi:MAG: hypothetical protein ACRD1P_08435 [Thermoanaerobaculia bacterium]